ncbi:hypothetical protein GY45DRAFT_1362902 [Cubamyces sp. BRFM 1775]|nr:hypothetical protein GY45DRAFT_1362902 [Cubamyces sp. BRFM 1775]
MGGRCEECGATTEWDPDLGSAICLQCGTLADPTQSVFTSHLDYVDSSREYTGWSNVPGGSTLRGRNGRVLAGQDKEARDRRNTISMHEFIRGLAGRLSNPGVTVRAQAIFDQAMTRGHYRWGRRAKLTAGAALAIALRESHKSDSIRDIADAGYTGCDACIHVYDCEALKCSVFIHQFVSHSAWYLLDEPPTSVSRAFSAVVDLLGLKLSTADPAIHLPSLQTYLVSVVNGTETGHALPGQLTKLLPDLTSRLPSVMRTANALSALLERTHILAHLPTPPTACALLILALEAEHGSSLPHAGALAQTLGTRVGAGKGVVMQRYKQIYDLVEEWIRDVPWLDAHQRKAAKGRQGGGRSKVAKRVVVARGVKDVVQFQEEIWRKRVESAGRPSLQLDVDEKDDEDAHAGEWDGSSLASSSGASQAPSGSSAEVHARRSKRAKTRHPKSIVDASHFLLNPLSTSAFPSPASLGPASASTSASAGPSPSQGPDLVTHLLTADASSLSNAFREAPSRLQLLAAARGGADEAHIADEELFGEDELEGILRSEEEAQAVRIAMGWDVEEMGFDEAGEKRGRKRKRGEVEDEAGSGESRRAGKGKGKGKEKEKQVGSKRIDMDALERLLNPDADLDIEHLGGTNGGDDDEVEYAFDPEKTGYSEDEKEDEDEYEDGEDDDEQESVKAGYPTDGPSTVHARTSGGDEEIVEEWRPMSPGGAGGGSAEDWYDF